MSKQNKQRQPLILITNDDGIDSPGLWAAVEALCDLGELLIAAPHVQQTGMGRSFPHSEEGGVIDKVVRVVGDRSFTAYSIHGSPAQAVSHAVLELADRKPDLCVSGINYGENLGLSLTCSGTLGAAFESDSHGLPSIAVSRQADLSIQQSSEFVTLNWEASKHATFMVARKVLKEGMPEGVVILNVNIPDDATVNTPMRITAQSRLNYSVFIKPGKRDFDKSYRLTSKLDIDRTRTERNSDIYAFFYDKVISITPLTWRLSIETDWTYE